MSLINTTLVSNIRHFFYIYVSEYETSQKSGKSQLPDIVCVITGMILVLS